MPLTATAVEALRRQADRRRVLSVPNRALRSTCSPAASKRWCRCGRSAENRWAARTGASEVNLWHLRHFAATAMLDAGESYRTVADILGNSESTLRLHYDGRTDVGKRRAIAALELEPSVGWQAKKTDAPL